MRVRHLQTHLVDQQLIHEGKLSTLKGLRIGIDAVYWLRSIQALKDPFADALGGVPPGIFGFVDRELEYFRKYEIVPVFVFQGIAPGPQHSMFINRMDPQMELAWGYLMRGQKSEAQKCFAVSTSRINGDFVYFIFHHLRQRGCEVLMAPYFAGAQLAHFAEQKVVQTIFGPPGLLLYNVQKVIVAIDFLHQTFEWADLHTVLQKWQLNADQFIDACMLAGTEYCLTYPFLNPTQGGQHPSGKFNFEAAISLVKKNSLINWMGTFPSDEMKADHIEGYCMCKVLVQSSPVLSSKTSDIQPLGPTVFQARPDLARKPTVPGDFNEIMGAKLPSAMYYLMVQGVISHKILQAFAKGEWVDKSQPLVDTNELRTLLGDLNDYREKSINLMAKHLHSSFRKPIIIKAFWEQPTARGASQQQASQQNQEVKRIHPNPEKGLRWRITKESLEAEKKRQGRDSVDLKFCLQWHTHEFNTEGELYKDLCKFGESSFSKDAESLSCLVHFMLLEHLELISDDGGMTVIGNALKDSPKHLMEPCLIALELMKFGVLNGEPFEPSAPDRPFPQALGYPQQNQPINQNTKSIFLLTRIMSLIPMRLKCDMWNADVIFDLAAFHSKVRVLKKSLRQLTEASLASILIKDLKQVALLPPGFLCASPASKDHLQPRGFLPTFMLHRACMGIVASFFLGFQQDRAHFEKELSARFPCCLEPRADLQLAMVFWEEFKRCVDEMCHAGLECQEMQQDLLHASELLKKQQHRVGLFPEPSVLRGDEHPKVKAAVPGAL